MASITSSRDPLVIRYSKALSQITGVRGGRRARSEGYLKEFLTYSLNNPRYSLLLGPLLMVGDDSSDFVGQTDDVDTWLADRRQHGFDEGEVRKFKELFELYWKECRRQKKG